MFVPCPHCGFLVALIVSNRGAAQLCPRCRQRLDDDMDDATTTANDVGGSRPIDAAAADVEPAPAATTTPATVQPPVGSATPATPGAPATPAPTPTSTGTTSRAPRRRRHHAPSFARIAARAAPTTGPRWPGRLAIAGLALLLVAQLLLAQRHELAGSERWRPLLAGTCALLGCELPPWREPAAYTMLARSVQPAQQPGVLDVSASFRNDARWPQPWPSLSLSLSDVRGQPVAQRTFAPGDYRGGDAATTAPLAPGQSASVQFEVVEPTAPIVAFTFEFR